MPIVQALPYNVSIRWLIAVITHFLSLPKYRLIKLQANKSTTTSLGLNSQPA